MLILIWGGEGGGSIILARPVIVSPWIDRIVLSTRKMFTSYAVQQIILFMHSEKFK